MADTGDLAAGVHSRALWIDIDNDGDLDLFGIGHENRERLYRNEGDCTFTDISDFDGDGTPDLGDISPSLTASTGDFDADGLLDVYVGNYELCCGGGPDYDFVDTRSSSGMRVYDYPALKLYHNYSSAWCDFDQDGDLDLITYGRATHEGTENVAHLFRNDGGNEGRWIEVRLRGNAGFVADATNRFAVGARVTALHGGLSQMREVQGGHGYHTAMNSATQFFGFGPGSTEDVQQITVRWTNAMTDTFSDVGMRQRVLVFEGGTQLRRGSDPQNLPVHDAEAKLFPYTDSGEGTILYYQVDDPRARELLYVEKGDAGQVVLLFR